MQPTDSEVQEIASPGLEQRSGHKTIDKIPRLPPAGHRFLGSPWLQLNGGTLNWWPRKANSSWTVKGFLCQVKMLTFYLYICEAQDMIQRAQEENTNMFHLHTIKYREVSFANIYHVPGLSPGSLIRRHKSSRLQRHPSRRLGKE